MAARASRDAHVTRADTEGRDAQRADDHGGCCRTVNAGEGRVLLEGSDARAAESLDSDRMALAAAQAQVQDLGRYVRPDGSMTRTVADNMFKARDTATQLAATVVSDEREITNLQEEARRAGVPPGWLRP